MLTCPPGHALLDSPLKAIWGGISARDVFMLQMSTLLLQKPCGWSVKNLHFRVKLRQKSVCFDEKRTNFRVKHTNS